MAMEGVAKTTVSGRERAIRVESTEMDTVVFSSVSQPRSTDAPPSRERDVQHAMERVDMGWLRLGVGYNEGWS